MFIPFTIKSQTIKELLRGNTYTYSVADRIRDHLKSNINLDSIKREFIDGTRLQEEWFPSNYFDSQFDVFISHAHKDETMVKEFAGYLNQKYGLRSFIDSCYWGYADDLQKSLDDYYSLSDYGMYKGYDYSTSNFMAANVHIMLSMALMKMMDACECLIFVDSEQSLKYNKAQSLTTLSPWIYEEIGFTNSLRINIPQRYKDKLKVKIYEDRIYTHILLESFSASVQREPEFNYKVDMKNFKELAFCDFVYKPVMPSFPPKILDQWYSKYGVNKAISRVIND